MPQTSQLGRLERMDPDGLGPAEPVSVYRAWSVRNNLMHLLDEYPQHRINWVTAGLVQGSHIYMYLPWMQGFTHTWTRIDKPANLDILIDIVKGDFATDFDLVIQVDVLPIIGGSPGAPILSFSSSQNTASMTAISVFGSFDGTENTTFAELGNVVAVPEDAVARFALLTEARIQIMITSIDTYALGHLDTPFLLERLLVREYA